MPAKLVISDDFVKNKIYSIRGKQVMLDRDLAELYEIETRSLKQSVKRNLKRFPENFMFQLDEAEIYDLVSQNVIPSKKYLGGALPYAFTEQGVAMLSSILNSDKAIDISILIINAFISMRKFLTDNSLFFQKFHQIDKKLLTHDKNFEKVFDALQLNAPAQGVFFDGEVFDAFKFIYDLIKKAKQRIVLIDNYVDENTLYFFTKTDVKVLILTKNISSKEILKYKSQYSNIEFKEFDKSHDRFLIIDDEVYLFGASLKDAGKKWFGFFKVQDAEVLKKIRDYV